MYKYFEGNLKIEDLDLCKMAVCILFYEIVQFLSLCKHKNTCTSGISLAYVFGSNRLVYYAGIVYPVLFGLWMESHPVFVFSHLLVISLTLTRMMSGSVLL